MASDWPLLTGGRCSEVAVNTGLTVYIYVCVCREREIEIETNLEIEERETNISGWTHFDSNVSAVWSHFQEMSVNSTNLIYF
jgi:hypothetical protein